jgi:hypothetical protein
MPYSVEIPKYKIIEIKKPLYVKIPIYEHIPIYHHFLVKDKKQHKKLTELDKIAQEDLENDKQ